MDDHNKNEEGQQDQDVVRPMGYPGLDRRRAGAAARRARARYAERYARVRAGLMARPPLQRWLLIGLWTALALMVLFAIYVAMLFPLTPGIEDVKQARVARPTVVVSSDGRELASFEQGLQEKVKLSEISPNVITALVSTEDHRFYEHHGVDFTRIGGALLANLKGDAQGGSTITQQLARNMFRDEIGSKRNLNRKLKELITAF